MSSTHPLLLPLPKPLASACTMQMFTVDTAAFKSEQPPSASRPAHINSIFHTDHCDSLFGVPLAFPPAPKSSDFYTHQPQPSSAASQLPQKKWKVDALAQVSWPCFTPHQVTLFLQKTHPLPAQSISVSPLDYVSCRYILGFFKTFSRTWHCGVAGLGCGCNASRPCVRQFLSQLLHF